MLIYETGMLGVTVKVYTDRVEYKGGPLAAVDSIPITQIASVRSAPIMNKLTIETTGGRRSAMITGKKREVTAAIYWAMATLRGEIIPPFVTPPRAMSMLTKIGIGAAAFTVGMAILGALGSADSDHSELCGDYASARDRWIHDSSTELQGYSPATFNMSATGSCSTELRVRERDCSVTGLVDAYGHKPFMLTAKSLGFTRISCGYDEYDMSLITGM